MSSGSAASVGIYRHTAAPTLGEMNQFREVATCQLLGPDVTPCQGLHSTVVPLDALGLHTQEK